MFSVLYVRAYKLIYPLLYKVNLDDAQNCASHLRSLRTAAINDLM